MATQRNPLLDGWRGISVSLVIIDHFVHWRLANGVSLEAARASGAALSLSQQALYAFGDYAVALAGFGVSTFYIISGYIITHLLRREELREGAIHVGAFYVRRVFRIMPAFYAMVFTMIALNWAGLIVLPGEAMVRGAAFVCNVDSTRCAWWLTHTWSVSTEEQFYLLWPLLFLAPPPARRMIMVGLAVLALVLTVDVFATAFSFEYILIGAFVAHEEGLRAKIAAQARYANAATLFVLASPFLAKTEFVLRNIGNGAYLGLTIVTALALGFVVFAALEGRGLAAGLIARPWAQKIGLVSYSLYLWQQMSFPPAVLWGASTGADVFIRAHAFTALLFIPLALASYYGLEKPMIALGRRLLQAKADKPALA